MGNSAYGEQTTLHSPAEPATAHPEAVLALSIAYHPDLARVGETAFAAPGTSGWEISRIHPPFFAPGALAGRPLDDPFLTRTPLVMHKGASPGAALTVEVPDKVEIEVDGQPMRARLVLGPERLARGVVFLLAGRIVLVAHLRSRAPSTASEHGLIGASDGIARVCEEIRSVADRDVGVLIRGETGTGKELVARAIHAGSARARGPFVAINLGAIPASLMTSELFGHVGGAFTGARAATPGHFVRAQGGTILLDEVAEMPPDAQAVLLRVLEERTLVPLGGSSPVRLDVRVLAATDADIEALATQARFRAPLLHRLAGYTIQLPSLRARRDDIGRLLAHFLAHEMRALGAELELTRPAAQRPWLPARVAATLAAFDWPGNIRQLQNVVRQIVLANRGRDEARLPPELAASLQPSPTAGAAPDEAPATPPGGSPRPAHPVEISDERLAEVLERAHFSTAVAARTLGISRTTLYALMERSGRVRKARDIDAAELRACLAACNGDLTRSAEQLRVSDRALRLRLRELGLEPA